MSNITPIAAVIDHAYGLRGNPPEPVRAINQMIRARKAKAFAEWMAIQATYPQEITFPAHAQARDSEPQNSTPDGDSIHEAKP